MCLSGQLQPRECPGARVSETCGCSLAAAGPAAAGPSRKRQFEEEEEELDDDVKKRLAALRGQG